ncbi:MAG: dihydroxy-acid dehydratase [Solirubrobacterales bacterium]|nr:dihydroxy-acid dehydratase [Solirubrobacterales bacterium]
MALRSGRWFGGHDLAGFVHRSALRAEGLSSAAFDGRPIVGICNSWSELVNCNVHFQALAGAIARGVLQAGGLPLQFPTISLGEQLMKPTTMLYRNLMAMDVEESLRSYPLDAVVLLAGCDKTVPAQLMGAASADVPAIMVTGGPAKPAVFRGRQLGVGTDLWRYTDDLRAGRITQAEYDELEAAAGSSVGHCPEMGTASTMAAIVEALGMSLPGSAAPPAGDARRYAAAEAAGRRAVALAHEELRPSRILTPTAFDNAITALIATGGSTNAVPHLLALAGRAGVELTLERFDELARHTPMIVNVRPAGEHLVEQLFHAGGVPAVLRELAPLLDLTALTVSGRTLGETLPDQPTSDPDVIASLEDPVKPTGGLVVLRGSLAPRGALLKPSVASERLLRHSGTALVFDDIDDLAARIDDPALEVDANTILVLRNAGPIGAPGMPEWGQLPIPERLLRAGVDDMVRVSDARMSGTAFGTTVLHVAPEGAIAGPLAVAGTGDRIELDVEARRIDLAVEPGEIERRIAEWAPPARKYDRGYGSLFLDHVLQADEGCDFDFLRGRSGQAAREPYGILQGTIGGW